MRRRALGVFFGLIVGCFDAPAAVVMFSCEPDGASACPDGYTCEADGCCHRDGSDVNAHAGECKLQGATDGATTLLPGTSSTGTSSTGTSGSTTATGSSDGSTASSDGSSGATTGPSDGSSGTASATGGSSTTG
jgi:hypothetical protein